jgi:ribonuclease HI
MSEIPEFYKRVIQITTMDEKSTTEIPSGAVDRPFPIRKIARINNRWNETVERIDQANIEIWTDGSLLTENNSTGTSAIYVESAEEHTVKQTIKMKPPEGNNFSTRSELWAIYRALYGISDRCKATIYTDSQAAIEAIKSTVENQISTRKLIKYTNNGILRAIKIQYERLGQNKPTLIRKKITGPLTSPEKANQPRKR